jgi:hypothetical protein
LVLVVVVILVVPDIEMRVIRRRHDPELDLAARVVVWIGIAKTFGGSDRRTGRASRRRAIEAAYARRVSRPAACMRRSG